jgi:hypothetical protein
VQTVKFFSKGDRIYVRCQQIWLVLVSHVRIKSSTITYGTLADYMGYDSRAGHTLGKHLGVIGHFCLLNELPLINSIVVNKNTGYPGDDVFLGDDNNSIKNIDETQKDVINYDWFSVRVPTVGAFKNIFYGDNNV